MPISAPSLGDDEDRRDPRFQDDDLYESESLEFPGLTPVQAEAVLNGWGRGWSKSWRWLRASAGRRASSRCRVVSRSISVRMTN